MVPSLAKHRFLAAILLIDDVECICRECHDVASPHVGYTIPNSKLRLACLNVRGLFTNSDYVKMLLNDLDILAISEHWLHNYNLAQLQNLCCDFSFVANSSPQEEDSIYCVPKLVRGHGGVALGWHSSLDRFITTLPFVNSCRMVGIELHSPLYHLFIISVYLPSRSGCTDKFKEALDQLEGALMLLPEGADVVIMGDFNADLGHLGGPMSHSPPNEQGKILSNYLINPLEVCIHPSTPVLIRPCLHLRK